MRRLFGRLPDGQDVDVFSLRNGRGVEARILTFGSVLQSVSVPDRSGRFDSVVLGKPDLESYLEDTRYLGPVVGRYCGRIGGARFRLDGVVYDLPANDGPNHLHGGPDGFQRRIWSVDSPPEPGRPALTLRLDSPDGDAGYPGAVRVTATYVLDDAGALTIDFEAITDRPTPLNLTQHAYYNLAGGGRGTILDHELTIHADAFTRLDEALIPTGEILPVDGTPLDFRKPVAIGARIADPHEQMRRGRGYDHNYVLRGSGALPVHAARLVHPRSGRRLDVHTNEPGLQLYSGNHLGPHAGVCLETQHFPDSPNRPEFPTTIVHPGERFRSRTVLSFGLAG
jgi:aldose 1-epimerase